MIQNYSPAEIIGTGINQSIMHQAPHDMVTRLRGALALCHAGDGAPVLFEHKQHTAVVIESIPPPNTEAVQDA